MEVYISMKDLTHNSRNQTDSHPVSAEHADGVISVKNVSKKFCRHLRRSMAYGIIDLSKNLLGLKPDTTTLRASEFWALDQISFELKNGDRLGIIGTNGSGKTTLLRLLTGIFPPDKGEIQVKGRVGALVAVGAGFHPHMTGRENIFLNGTLLGMNKHEIQEKFEEIVEFSEIGDFLDAPVSTYSSGMRVRLGFAIAIHCEPDILLVDEVLSVGDLAFRNKSLRKMHEYRERANAVIFVSHQLEQVRALCNRVIILNKGTIAFNGNTHEGCAVYEEMIRETRFHELAHKASQTLDPRIKKRLTSAEEFELLDIGILDVHHQKATAIRMDDPLIMYWDFRVKKEIEEIYFNAGVWNESDVECLWVTSKDKTKVQFPLLKPGEYRIIITIQEHHLVPNIYMPSIFIRSDKTGETYERIWSSHAFRVITDGKIFGSGIIANQANWELTEIDF